MKKTKNNLKRKQFGGEVPKNIVVNSPAQDHKFKQTFYIQDNYENHRFLWISYKKLIGKNAIPIGLCEVCNKLEIEHNA